MKRKAAGPPDRAQRSITSFIYHKCDQNQWKGGHADRVEDEALAPPSAAHNSGHIDRGEEAQTIWPTALQTQEPEVAARKEKFVDAADRHRILQEKLVTGYGQAARTQDALQKQFSLKDSGHQKFTPLEQQVIHLLKQNPETILAIEVGYKFKFYGEHAEIASRVLKIGAWPDRNFLSCWIPSVRLAIHVRRLVEAGYRVGVVRQTETAALKSVSDTRNKTFERKLTDVYTRATLEAGALGGLRCDDMGHSLDDDNTGTNTNSLWSSERLTRYLLAIIEKSGGGAPGDAVLGLVSIETSTGDVFYSEFKDNAMRPELERRLLFSPPCEVIVSAQPSSFTKNLIDHFGAPITLVVEECDAPHASSSDDVSCIQSLPSLVRRALGLAVGYLKPLGLDSVIQLNGFREFGEASGLVLAPNTINQLEIFKAYTGDTHTEKGSLLWLLDRTLTSPGGRLLRTWVARPLRSADAINGRLDAVQNLTQGTESDPTLSRLPHLLKTLPDLERCLTRAHHGTSTPAEFVTMLQAFASLPSKLLLGPLKVESSLNRISSPLLRELLEDVGNVGAAREAVHWLQCIDATAAAADDKLRMFISSEMFPVVAERQKELDDSKAALDALLPELARIAKLRSLYFVSVQNQGDFLVEVPLECSVPKDWVRVTATKKVARYQPPCVKAALKEYEMANERLILACDDAWKQVQCEFARGVHHAAFRKISHSLAQIDCLISLASLAGGRPGYVRPNVKEGEDETFLNITCGRHPVLDVILEGRFIPNDIFLSNSTRSCMIITGPNMGGKSVLVKSAALIALMAQIGSYVPADAVEMTAFDGVYTRMGASDCIALGRSTFCEELTEMSDILQKSTAKSLVIIDELGRGTATQDGIAIASATLEHIVDDIRPLTLFITHYPEVAEMFEGSSIVTMHHMGFLKQDTGENCGVPSITFLYKARPGMAGASYGLNVARMAGLPRPIVDRATVKAVHARDVKSRLRDLLRLCKPCIEAGGDCRERLATFLMFVPGE